MHNNTVVFPPSISILKLLIVLLCCVGLVGCSTLKSITSNKDSKLLFKSRDQFVQIVKQDSEKGVKVPANGHPVSLDEGQIRMALASLEFTTPGKDSSSPVFDAPELDVLARYLPAALAQVSPEEDVAFAVVGNFKAVYGLAKEQMYTSGRVFYRDGKLNIIFGEIHGKYWANADRRLYPLAPGSRFKSTVHTWALVNQPDQEFYSGPEGQRTDWLVLDLASMEARAAMGEKAAATQAPIAVPSSGAQKSVGERLQILNDLKNKNLITTEEYEKKRLDILKDL
ncbi:MAG: SHOCT domain-containing protein [Geobacteraceae bacterium]